MRTRSPLGLIAAIALSACVIEEIPKTTTFTPEDRPETDTDTDTDTDSDTDTDTDTDSDTDTDTDTDTGGVLLDSIYNIQGGLIPEDTEVVVQGIVTGVAESGVYIQDPLGGQLSGVWVYLASKWEKAYGPVALGDLVQVEGTYIEHFDETEIEVPVGGTGKLAPFVNLGAVGELTPEVVDMASLAADPEPWEGVLITMSDVQITNEDIGFGEFEVTDANGAAWPVDDRCYLYDGIVLDKAFETASGVFDYTFEAYKLMPRAETDLVEAIVVPTGETGVVVPTADTNPVVPTADTTPVVPTGDTAPPVPTADTTPVVPTGDTAPPVPTADTTPVVPTADTAPPIPTADTGPVLPPAPLQVNIYDIQQGRVPEGSDVLFVAVVTGVGADGVFVQDLGGGMYSGIEVYLGNTAYWGGFSEGDLVLVEGQYEEFLGNSQVNLLEGSAPSINVFVQLPPLPGEVVAMSDLADPILAEAWEGVLVIVEDVSVLNPNAGFGEFVVQDQTLTHSLVIDDLLHLYTDFGTLVAGDTFSSIEGPLSYTVGAFKIVPRSDSDIVQ